MISQCFGATVTTLWQQGAHIKEAADQACLFGKGLKNIP